MPRIEFKHQDMDEEFVALLLRAHESFEDRKEFVQFMSKFLAEGSDEALRDLRTSLMVYGDLTLGGGIDTEISVGGNLN